jgi:hypothetical protein
MSLTQLQQIAMAEEATEGTQLAFSSLLTAANAKYLVIEPSLTYSPDLYERKIKRGTLTPLQPLTGAKRGSVRFQLEMASEADAIGSPPLWDLPLKACGWASVSCARLTTGAITGGPLLHGETITFSGGATRVVVGDTYTGMTTLFVTNSFGLGNTTAIGATDTYTGATSGATGTLSAAAANKARAWWPWSYPLTRLKWDATTGLTTSLLAGDLLQGATSGAIAQVYYDKATDAGHAEEVYVRRIRGHFAASEVMKIIAPVARIDSDIGTLHATNFEIQAHVPTISIAMLKDGVVEALFGCRGSVSFQGNIGEPMLMSFEFTGAQHTESPTDAANLTGVQVSTRVPPVLLGASMSIGKITDTFAQEISPCITQLSLNGNATVSYRRCMSAASGLLETLVTARNLQGALDPEMAAESVFPYLGQFLNNADNRLRFNVGTTIPDKFEMRMHHLSFRASADGDREGIATRQLDYNLHSGSTNVGTGDNEMCIIWEVT